MGRKERLLREERKVNYLPVLELLIPQQPLTSKKLA